MRDHLHATAGLQDGVHPLIESEARLQFMLEKYELGVFAAMRASRLGCGSSAGSARTTTA
jgi:hypothetical protein